MHIKRYVAKGDIKNLKVKINNKFSSNGEKINDNGGASMELMVKASPRDKLKNLALKSKQRREQMKNFIFTEKDRVANENFNDLEKEVYSNIK